MSLFNSYSTKGKLKFFKINNDAEEITIGISVNSNHKISENIYDNVSKYLDTLLIKDYQNEDVHNEIKEAEKEQAKAQKEQAKMMKQHEKKKQSKLKAKMKEEAKSKKLYDSFT